MAYARVWYEPSGEVKVTTFIDGADPEAVKAILIKDGHLDAAATWDEAATQAELASLLPPDRGTRQKWRKNPGGKGVIVDATIPDPADPDQDLVDLIQAATGFPDLKIALRKVLQRARKGT